MERDPQVGDIFHWADNQDRFLVLDAKRTNSNWGEFFMDLRIWNLQTRRIEHWTPSLNVVSQVYHLEVSI